MRTGENTLQIVFRSALRVGRERDVYVKGNFKPTRETVQSALSLTGHTCNAYTDNILFLAEPKDLRLSDPILKVEVMDFDPECFVVTVSTKRFAPYVWLRVDNWDSWSGEATGMTISSICVQASRAT